MLADRRFELGRAARSYRRVTFIHTTLDRLLAAGDVLDLFQHEDPNSKSDVLSAAIYLEHKRID